MQVTITGRRFRGLLSIALACMRFEVSSYRFPASRVTGLHRHSWSATNDELMKLRVPELKDKCRERGLHVSGTKAVLVERLLQSNTGEEDGLESSRGNCEETVRSGSLPEVSQKLPRGKKEGAENRSEQQEPSWKELKASLRKKGISYAHATSKHVLLRRLETNGGSIKDELLEKQQSVIPEGKRVPERPDSRSIKRGARRRGDLSRFSSWEEIETALRKRGISCEYAASKSELVRRLETNGASMKEELIEKYQGMIPDGKPVSKSDAGKLSHRSTHDPLKNEPNWKEIKTASHEKDISSHSAATKHVLMRRLQTNGASINEELLEKRDSKNSGNPLHGITLKKILETLHEELGWQELARMVPIRCFQNNPSMKSSLTFLRRTPWARAKVEEQYIAMLRGDIV